METMQSIRKAYKALALEKKVLPLSLKETAESAGVEFEEAKQHYEGVRSVQEDIWLTYLRDTLEAMEASPEFAEYLVREKLLAFYFTLFEMMGEDREFLQLFQSKLGIWNYDPDFLMPFKAAFIEFVEMLVEEGASNEEVTERMVLGGQYAGWHWPQMLYLLNHWIDDTTEAFVKTDQAIEKSVNLGFDIMGRNVLDSAFDFMKFVVTRR